MFRTNFWADTLAFQNLKSIDSLLTSNNFVLECSVINDGKFINNEFNDVYLVTTRDPIPLEAFTLQVRMSMIKFIDVLKSKLTG